MSVGGRPLADLPLAQFQVFMDGVGNKAEAALRALAEKDGRFPHNELYGIGGDHISNATTRRVRTVTGNPELVLMGWDETTGDYVVSPKTTQSMKSYFQIS